MATTSASFKSRRRRLKKTWLPPNGPSLFKTDRAFLSLTVMGSRNYGSWHGSIGCRIGVHRSPHARRWRERGGRWEALPERPQQVWCDKEDGRRLHLPGSRAVS